MRQIAIRLPEALLAQLDALIAETADTERLDRSALIRRYIALGMAADRKTEK